ncbi:MAG: DUF1549 domain-containing protein, partial [Singulisphaera sp.]
PGGSSRLSVVARFADGEEADVTPFCDLHVRDEAVAEVALDGEVRGLRPGDTAVVASYNGRLASARVLVPTGRVVIVPDVYERDVIDREVFAKLRGLGVAPSRPATDAEFLRRVTLDVIGALPSPQDVRAFLRDGDADKRSRKIDELLADPMHAALWARGSSTSPAATSGRWKGRRTSDPAGRGWARLVPQAVRRQHPVLGNRAGSSRRRAESEATPTPGPPRSRADDRPEGRSRQRLRVPAGP